MEISALNKLVEKRDRLANQMRELVENRCDGDDPAGFSGEDDQAYRNMDDELTRLDNTIAAAKRSRDIDTGLEAEVNRINEDEHRKRDLRSRPNEGADPWAGASQEVRDFYNPESARRDNRPGAFLRNGVTHRNAGPTDTPEYVGAFRQLLRDKSMLSIEQRQILGAHRVTDDAESRAQTVTTTGGGYLVPVGFANQIEISELAYGGIINVADVMPTASGNPLDWPTIDGTAQKGRLLGINTQETTTDLTFGTIQFGAYKFSSDQVLIPIELAQDTGIGLDALIARLLGERLGRIMADYLATGTGSSEPQGIVTASSEGATTGGAASSNLTFTDINNLIHSVDPAYRTQGAGFVFHDDTLKLLKGLRDETNSNRPLWAPSVGSEVPSTIDGYPYQIDQSVPKHGDNSPDGSEKIVLFGRLSKFTVRRVMGLTLNVLTERYADYHQVAYNAIERWDSKMLDAGTDPVKHLAAKA